MQTVRNLMEDLNEDWDVGEEEVTFSEVDGDNSDTIEI